MKLYTIGHSNRSFDEFIYVLNRFGIEVLFDVRRFPKSKFRWFNRDFLKKGLITNGIDYIHLSELGGYRKFGRDVRDRGIARCFKSEGFRAYATYILYNKSARRALKYIEKVASSKTVVLMCSEKIPWKCHRKILSDWFLARGFVVYHIIEPNYIIKHKLSKCAKIVDGELVYE